MAWTERPWHGITRGTREIRNQHFERVRVITSSRGIYLGVVTSLIAGALRAMGALKMRDCVFVWLGFLLVGDRPLTLLTFSFRSFTGREPNVVAGMDEGAPMQPKVEGRRAIDKIEREKQLLKGSWVP